MPGVLTQVVGWLDADWASPTPAPGNPRFLRHTRWPSQCAVGCIGEPTDPTLDELQGIVSIKQLERPRELLRADASIESWCPTGLLGERLN